jgi:HPt (histidine-containing phosphotransfer) domain-containing protein/HAMP domain-containing protein
MTSTPRAPARISVGTKLAAVTIVLILAVTVGVYEALSRNQRENLLRAKEMSAEAVTQLFVGSCAAGVVFGDDQAVKDGLKTLGHNEDVEYAAVWAAEQSGKITRPIGEFERQGPKLSLSQSPSSSERVREDGRVRIASAIQDQDGKIVGATAVAFSLRAENKAIASLKKQTLLASSGVALLLVIVLVVMARVIVTGPLNHLVKAANAIGKGERVDVDINTGDEVGQLAHAFRDMTVAIRDREERIQARNRDIRLVLDNVGQGFITLESDGTLSSERSRVVDEWFGAPEGQVKFWEYLEKSVDSGIAWWFSCGWEMIHEDQLPLDLCLDQLPKVARRNERVFEFAYRPIVKDDKLAKLIVVIDDVTARVEREKAERSQRETMSIFRRMLSDRCSLDDFFVEVSEMVREIVDFSGDDLKLLKRQIHTVKGNASLFGIESVAELCHDLEDKLNGANGDQGLSPADRDLLKHAWAKIVSIRDQLVEGGLSDGVQIDGAEYTAFLSALAKEGAQERLLAIAESWRFEPATKRLSLMAEQIQALGVRMQKAPIAVICEPTTLRLPQSKWRGFWTAFAHVVRNTVDHGVETPEERTQAGKDERAIVKLSLRSEQDTVIAAIRDDGRGINWEAVAARAREQGLPHSTMEDLKAALFADGFSTRTEVTATSGRGVGLAAIQRFMDGIGGRIELHSEPGRGTEFRFKMPASVLTDRPPLS